MRNVFYDIFFSSNNGGSQFSIVVHVNYKTAIDTHPAKYLHKMVAFTRIELFFPGWKPGVLTDRRMGRIVDQKKPEKVRRTISGLIFQSAEPGGTLP